MSINEILASRPVVPLIQADDPAVAVKTAEALAKGGLAVAEVVFRTDRALECLRAVADELPDVIAGAGTVLSEAQANAALDNGAKFIVSPGFDDGVVGVAKERGVPVYPGIMTPSEVQRAFNAGLDTVKFFPPAIKALASVFRTMKFMPTGGVSAANLGEFLAVPSILACGGSWLTPAADIAAGNYDAVTALAAEAVEIASAARP